MAIRSFRDSRLASLFKRDERVRGLPASLAIATRRRLNNLNAAKTLDDLRSPPGNRLHALKDDRAGQHAIRVNDQYRLTFVWTDEGPEEVELVDYH